MIRFDLQAHRNHLTREPLGRYPAKYLSVYFIIIILTLQYCIGFAIHQHESSIGVHVLHNLNPPPTFLRIPSLWVIPVGTVPSTLSHASNLDWRSVSHMVIYISMLFSQIIPASPSPTESKRLFYTSVSLLLSRI